MGKLLTRKEAAERMQVSISTLDMERATGKLGYIQRKANGRVWIDEDAIAEYLARATHPARPEMALRETYRKRRA